MPEVGRLTKRPEFLRAAGRGRLWPTRGLVLQAYCRQPNETPAKVTPFVSMNKGSTGQGSGQTDVFSEAETTQTAETLARVGFTASKKVGSAVARNRARRRLRAVAADVLPRLGLNGIDYVLIARAGTLTRDFGDLTRDLLKALEVVALPEDAYQARQSKNRGSFRPGGRGRKQAAQKTGRGREKQPSVKAKTAGGTVQ